MISASAYLSPGASHQFSREQEREFYRRIKTSNGTKKSTSPRRLDAMNALFFAIVARQGLVPKVAMDIGISSGVTTLEWLEGFQRHGLPVSMIATDLVMSVDLYAIGRHIRVLTEKNGHLLQIELFGRGVRTHMRGRDYLNGGIIWRNALCLAIRLMRRHAIRQGTYQLVSPALRGQERIRLCDDDIFLPNAPHFIRAADVVRVANLLQPIYFSDEQIRRAARHIGERCRGEGSLLIVCRNTDTGLDGSILRMTASRQFTVAARLGRGSEVEGYFTEPV